MPPPNGGDRPFMLQMLVLIALGTVGLLLVIGALALVKRKKH